MDPKTKGASMRMYGVIFLAVTLWGCGAVEQAPTEDYGAPAISILPLPPDLWTQADSQVYVRSVTKDCVDPSGTAPLKQVTFANDSSTAVTSVQVEWRIFEKIDDPEAAARQPREVDSMGAQWLSFPAPLQPGNSIALDDLLGLETSLAQGIQGDSQASLTAFLTVTDFESGALGTSSSAIATDEPIRIDGPTILAASKAAPKCNNKECYLLTCVPSPYALNCKMLTGTCTTSLCEAQNF